ncbi:FCD domain-containing protein [Ponticoccus litoralis]|uniref:FCD domain-containing protein n=1 Tax=Ponticoccus litoralis TaxID=422297 RepID=A0AAW9SIK2_9RHOB
MHGHALGAGARRRAADPADRGALSGGRAAPDARRPAGPRARGDPTATGTLAIGVDLSLHNALSEGLDNPYLQEAYRQNRDRIAVIQQTRPFLMDRITSAMEEHLDIIAAMEARDLRRVEETIDIHLVQTLRWWGM